MIRQAISCDICASEKKQTNHWFVAHDQNGELRITGWSSRNRLRPGSKHLCGQVCLHKLLDEFISRTNEVRLQAGAEEAAVQCGASLTDTSLTADQAYEDGIVAPARHIPVPEAAVPKPVVARPAAPKPVLPAPQPLRMPAELVAMPGRPAADEQPADGTTPRYASRNWRAEAWDRERERELRAIEHRDTGARRRSGS